MQAIAGSTRMQATSSQTFLISNILLQALEEIFQRNLTNVQLKKLNFDEKKSSIFDKLKSFGNLQKNFSDRRQIQQIVLNAVNLEYETYKKGGRALYFGNKLLTTLFIDLTERAPTFNLAALDPIGNLSPETQKSWVQVYTEASSKDEAWRKLLGRDFKGLDQAKYSKAFEKGISDPYLKQTALKNLNQATSEQGKLYDFSIQNFYKQKLTNKDIGFAYLLINETEPLLTHHAKFKSWLKSLYIEGSSAFIILVGLSYEMDKFKQLKQAINAISPNAEVEPLILDQVPYDSMQIKKRIALKLLLNAQSTLVMAQLERVLGNKMIFVYPSNLKLAGRATYLIMSCINEIINDKASKLRDKPDINYNETNAILYDAVTYIEQKQRRNKVAIIPLVIVRILEALQGHKTNWEDADNILASRSISDYINSQLQ